MNVEAEMQRGDYTPQRKKAELNPTCVPAENAKTSFRVSNVKKKKRLEQPKPLRRGGCQALT